MSLALLLVAVRPRLMGAGTHAHQGRCLVLAQTLPAVYCPPWKFPPERRIFPGAGGDARGSFSRKRPARRRLPASRLPCDWLRPLPLHDRERSIAPPPAPGLCHRYRGCRRPRSGRTVRRSDPATGREYPGHRCLSPARSANERCAGAGVGASRTSRRCRQGWPSGAAMPAARRPG